MLIVLELALEPYAPVGSMMRPPTTIGLFQCPDSAGRRAAAPR